MLSFLATLAIFFGATGPAPEVVQEASEQAYEQNSYQRELPITAKPQTPKAGKKLMRRPARKKGLGISNAILWFLTFIVLAVFVLWLVREFLGYLPDAEAEIEAAVLELGQSNAVVSAPLQDAKLLAQRAKYGEAIHALLLRTLMELGRTYPEPLPSSLTSREILDALQLAPAAHDALTGLISTVELCHFRGSEVEAEDYSRCLQHFEVFARAYVREDRAT